MTRVICHSIYVLREVRFDLSDEKQLSELNSSMSTVDRQASVRTRAEIEPQILEQAVAQLQDAAEADEDDGGEMTTEDTLFLQNTR